MVERYWSGCRWIYPEPAEPPEDFGPELIDWLDERRDPKIRRCFRPSRTCSRFAYRLGVS
jgi:hypothetical protein